METAINNTNLQSIRAPEAFYRLFRTLSPNDKFTAASYILEDEEIKYYINHTEKDRIREQLKQGALNRAQRDLKLYEEWSPLIKRGQRSALQRSKFSIDQILEMTSSSKESWAESIIEEREDRI